MDYFDPSPEELEAEFPGWEVFWGIASIVYARKLLSSPPIVLRDENTTELRVKMRIKQEELSGR